MLPSISLAVREAAGNKCEFCGVANGAVVVRSVDGTVWLDIKQDRCYSWPSGCLIRVWAENWNIYAFRHKQTKVVLTVVHVGLNKYDKTDCSNLSALCQACHLALDLPDHIAKWAQNEKSKNNTLS